MDTISSFINRRVKGIDALTITELIKKCGMSKAKFYRCLSEPFRFTDTDLDTIAQELHLSDSDYRQLFDFRDNNSNSHQTSDVTSEDKANINKIIRDIILGNIKTDTDLHSRVYKLFHSGDSDTGIQIFSARELVSKLSQLLADTHQCDQELIFEGIIFNCYTEHASRNLSTLMNTLGQQKKLLLNYDISFYHFINDSDMDKAGRFEALPGLYRLAAVSTFGCYSTNFSNLDNTTLGNSDCCLVRYQDHAQTERYILIHFLSENEVSVFSFSDYNLYTYLSYQYSSQVRALSQVYPFTLNSLEVSSYLIEKCKSCRSTMLTYTLCFDNYVPSMWDNAVEKYMSNPKTVQLILQHADPTGTLSKYTAEHFIAKLTDGFKARFRICEDTGRITILSARGLTEFAESGTTSELSPANVSFDDTEILTQLQYLYDHVGTDHAPGQSYYFIDDHLTPPDFALVIFDNAEVGMYFHNNQHTSIYWTILQESYIASEFYRYLALELTNNSSRQNFESILLSDEKARAHIQALIDDVKNRINAKAVHQD